jgi:hypothetical protein
VRLAATDGRSARAEKDERTPDAPKESEKTPLEPAPNTDWVKTIQIKRILRDDVERRDE